MTETKSRQPRTQTDKDTNPMFVWTMYETRDDFPRWGSAGRDEKLRAFAREEPILAGAVATMSSKATALDWQITGGRNRVNRYHEILGEAEDGQGWSYFLDRLVQDYVCTDIGGIVELARDGESGPVTALYNIDSTTCALTGNSKVPLRYSPKVGNGRVLPLMPGDFVRAVDMPANDESKFGMGYCAVSRALKAAKVLMALYRYEDERLSDLPPAGIASITGMTADEVTKAFKLYGERRESKEQQTFKGVLWLAATASPVQPIDVKLTPFSTLPDHFDKEKAMTLYVYTLALDFGVDVREFWPASQTGATKAEAEVQAQKAKGKGFGRMLSDIERAINWDVLPKGLEFAFDQQDSGDDLMRHQIHQAAIEGVRRLWEPTQMGEGIITTDEARRWLAEQGVLPAWVSATADSVAMGSENETDESETTPTPNVTGLQAAQVQQKALRAGLRPGEDLVTVNRNGDVQTVWTSRKVYSIQLPTPSLGAAVGFPFGVGRGANYP